MGRRRAEFSFVAEQITIFFLPEQKCVSVWRVNFLFLKCCFRKCEKRLSSSAHEMNKNKLSNETVMIKRVSASAAQYLRQLNLNEWQT